MRKTHALIVAAGSGSRFGSGDLKQYAPILGRPMLVWPAMVFASHPDIDSVTVIVRPGEEARAKKILHEYDIRPGAVVAGGDTRQQSVAIGLDSLPGAGRVLVHDAARPCLTSDLIARTVEALREARSVVPALAAVDTMVRTDGGNVAEVLDRAHIAGVQTPQGFSIAVLRRAHAEATLAGRTSSDDGSLVFAIDEAVKTIPGERTNIKITFEADIPVAEAILADRQGSTR